MIDFDDDTPGLEGDEELVPCSECGHLHFDLTARRYVACPVCDCAMNDEGGAA